VTMEETRSSWSNDQKYLVKASVTILEKTKPGLFNLLLTSIVIFEGSSCPLSKTPLFLSSYQIHSDDLDGELAEAERVGHAFIVGLG
jgi:hypothetical protein